MKNKKNSKAKNLPEWERLLSSQVIFQSHFPEAVLVGGTAASLHAGHRISIDADHVFPDLKKRFSDILKRVEQEAGWITKRIEPPVLILGHFQGMRTGIRQLIRPKPLETTIIRGLRIPTLSETLRIKAYLIVKRNTLRDFIDFVALIEHLGTKKSLLVFEDFDSYYPQDNESSITQQLCLQLTDPKPWDLSNTPLKNYKGLKAPYNSWSAIQIRSRAFAQRLIQQCLQS